MLHVTGRAHPEAKSTFQDAAPKLTKDLWLMAWNLGHLEDHAYHGWPQMVHILKKVQSLLKKTFKSENFLSKFTLLRLGAIPSNQMSNTLSASPTA